MSGESSAQLGSVVLGSCELGGESPDRVVLEKALRRFLIDAVGPSVPVYYMRGPEKCTYPYIVFEKDGEEDREQFLDDDEPASPVATYGFRVIIVTKEPEDLTTIAETIRTEGFVRLARRRVRRRRAGRRRFGRLVLRTQR